MLTALTSCCTTREAWLELHTPNSIHTQITHIPRSDVDRLDKQLRLFKATLEVWLEVQRNWMGLEPVFAAPDIQRQLPAEAHAFVQVGVLTCLLFIWGFSQGGACCARNTAAAAS